MRKKFLLCFTLLVILFSFSGCFFDENATFNDESEERILYNDEGCLIGNTTENRFIFLTDRSHSNTLVCDKETLVIYFYSSGAFGAREFSPLYNADGSLRLLTDETKLLEKYLTPEEIEALLSSHDSEKVESE